MQNEITELRNQVRTLKRIVCLVCCLFASTMFAGCEEKSAPQTQSPTPQAPTASQTSQVDEMQLAKSFTEFADYYMKRMQEREARSLAPNVLEFSSIDIERTQSILHQYRGKIIIELKSTGKGGLHAKSYLYYPSFNYVDGSWVFASAILVPTNEFVKKSYDVSTNLICVRWGQILTNDGYAPATPEDAE